MSIIAEAAFQHEIWDILIRKVALFSNISIIICEIEPAVAAKRHLQRGLNDASREFFHGDNRVTHFKKTGELLKPGEYQPPNFKFPTITVSTKDRYSPSLKSIKEKLFS
ncbi:MAG TPA: hypothetical protein VN397_02220 [Candidatus Methylomirabilis sp.]|nr:hypothetical protein [Candidatus Methylomirabilis sp.]